MSVGGRLEYAHRVAQYLYGEPPTKEKPCVLHICDNKLCVNPRHLYTGTRPENNEERVAKGRGGCGSGESHSEIMRVVSAKGESCYNAKLTEQDVMDIRSYKDQGCRLCDVAVFMGLCISTVNNIWYGRSWKHVK